MKIKLLFATLLLTLLFTGCASSQYSAANANTANEPFNAGVAIGQALGNALWGEKK